MTKFAENRHLRAALIYAKKLDWAVLPLAPYSKKPMTNHGFLDASKDEKQIIEWWTRQPKANIGIATGAKSGFFVLDVDTRNNGEETLEDLILEYGKLPDTVQAITGGGGSHYLFKYREGIGNKNNMLQGLDVKGNGGYIVAAPSIHPSGNHYEWELSSRPIENEILDAPEWVYNLILKPQIKTITAKPSSYWVDLFKNTSEGNRNNAATSLAGYLFRKYIDPALVIEIMQLWNKRVSPPLDEKELGIIINSVAGKELRRRGGKH